MAVDHGCPDPVKTVEAALRAFAERDVGSTQALCHPDFVLRPVRNRSAGEPYRGKESIARYYRDVDGTWDEFQLHPASYWKTEASVIAFGRIVAGAHGRRQTTEAMWIFRFRGGLIASVDVFEQPHVANSGGCTCHRQSGHGESPVSERA